WHLAQCLHVDQVHGLTSRTRPSKRRSLCLTRTPLTAGTMSQRPFLGKRHRKWRGIFNSLWRISTASRVVEFLSLNTGLLKGHKIMNVSMKASMDDGQVAITKIQRSSSSVQLIVTSMGESLD
ncbi:hypothetical protein Ccrd_010884, partial [Cynara cardunculus var. scolymus]